MWRKMSLRVRIYVLLAALVTIALSSGGVMVWYTQRMQTLFDDIIDRNLAAFDTAAALETALVNQKGFVTYYFIDGDPAWLKKLAQHRRIFQDRLEKAKTLAYSGAQRTAIDRIAAEYTHYVQLKDQVIGLYKQSKREEGVRLHKSVRQLFFDIIDDCEAYKLEQIEQLQLARKNWARVAANLRIGTATVIGFQMLLAIGIGIILVQQILNPVNQILKNIARNGESNPSGNVMIDLTHNVNTLLQNVEQAHSALEKSRENLQQAEKMALVGKLAAGMAHSIRNPFTSVKMRLFSLGRSLQLDATQQEDFDVISQEIRHIDTIVQNFLEFSRPPKLIMQPISPSSIVDHALQLLAHRLESYGVRVEVARGQALPEVMADPEQLKEVLVNLIINACEEMKTGGNIVIEEQVQDMGPQKAAVLSIADTGPGVPPSHAEKIFQPFFTDKDEGTGLGLSIAMSIVTEHGGTLSLENDNGTGAMFVIRLPLKETLR